MSDPTPTPDQPKQPEQPPTPPAIKPVNLPKPDGFGDINQQSKVNREKAKEEKKRRRKKGDRNHPKDPYQPVKNKRSCGCGGCLVGLILLILLPLAGGGLWFNHVKTDLTANQGYTWEAVSGKNQTVAPLQKTAFAGTTVLYEPKETTAEVAFIGGQWWIGGTFHEKVTFRGAILTIEPDSKFLKGLDVEAIMLDTGGAQIDGELTGRILKQK